MPGNFTFYSEFINEDTAVFNELEYRHAIKVCRYKIGDKIAFTDGNGLKANGVISEILNSEFRVKITSQQLETAPVFTLYIGLIKHPDRQEWLIEKCAEFGLKSVVFMQCERSEKSKMNLDRLNKICISALKQSHGTHLMQVQISEFNEVLNSLSAGGIAHYASAENKISLKKWNFDWPILIGPEGDFTTNEIKAAENKGFAQIDLGNKILRSETAGLVVASHSLL